MVADDRAYARAIGGQRAMSLNDVRERVIKDPKWFIENYMYIAAKGRQDCLLKYNHSQQQVWEKVEQKLKDNKPIRLVILKSRQVGISTQLSAYLFARFWSEKNLNALIIAHLKEVTGNLFKKQKKFYANLPPALRIPLERSNKQELIQPVETGGSQLFLATAGTPHAARSQTLHLVHGSEAAFYPDLEELKTALEASVPELPGTGIFWETTAFGAGTAFHDLWKSAVEGDTIYEGQFLKWFDDPECSDPPFESQMIQDAVLEQIYAKAPHLKARGEHYGLTPEQISFYYRWCNNKYKGNWLKMQQEFPCDPEEAFLASGQTIVPANVIQEYKTQTRVGTLYDPYADWNSDFKTLVPNAGLERGKKPYIEIWDAPRPMKFYLVAIDSASGHAQDNSCAYVFDIATQNVVAKLHGKIGPKQLAIWCMRLGAMYNYAQLVPETNGLGMATLTHMEGKYPNIYQRRQRGTIEGFKLTNKLGFDITVELRWIILNNMVRIMQDRLNDNPGLLLPDRMALDEMATFVQPASADQAPRAEKNCHDDCVMALAIGHYACLEELQMRPGILPTIQNSKEDVTNGEMLDIDKLDAMVADEGWMTGAGFAGTDKHAGPYYADAELRDFDGEYDDEDDGFSW